MADREVSPEIAADFIAQVGLAHLKKGVDAVGAGKTEIADTHFKRAREALLDALIAKYPDAAYQSDDLFVIQAERRKKILQNLLLRKIQRKSKNRYRYHCFFMGLYLIHEEAAKRLKQIECFNYLK
jgi:hypothetical protein